jgi:TonB family protein
MPECRPPRMSLNLPRVFFWAVLAQVVALCLNAVYAQALPGQSFKAKQSAPVALPLPPSQQEYWAQFDHKDWGAAIASAEKLVAAARAANPPDKFRLSQALVLLGNAQLGGQTPGAAEAAFAESLKLVEPYVNAGDPRLLDPLRGLGYSLAAQSKHEQAIPYMDRSLVVSRRNAGLFDMGQQGVLRQLADSFWALGRPVDGERYMIYLLRVGEHAYGNSDPRLAQVLCVVGNWYTEVGQMAPARESFRAALEVVSKKLGPLDLAAVEPLRLAAKTYIREVQLSNYGIRSYYEMGSLSGNQVERRVPTSADGTSNEGAAMNPRYISVDGERGLLQAIKALDAHENRSAQTLIDTLLQTGDWFVFKQQFEKGLPYYKRAWETLAAQPDAQQPGDEPLGFPVQVYYQTPVLATRNLARPPAEVEERFVQVEFTVKADGTVKDARVTDSNGTPRQVSQTLDAVETSRYRPKFVDGAPVETTALTFRQQFKLRKDAEKDAEKDETRATPTASTSP